MVTDFQIVAEELKATTAQLAEVDAELEYATVHHDGWSDEPYRVNEAINPFERDHANLLKQEADFINERLPFPSPTPRPAAKPPNAGAMPGTSAAV